MAWIPLLYFMYANGILGMMGIYQYGAVNGLTLAIALIARSKMK